MKVNNYNKLESLYEKWWNSIRYTKYHQKYGDVILLFELVSIEPIEFKLYNICNLDKSQEMYNFAKANDLIHQWCDSDVFCYQTMEII